MFLLDILSHRMSVIGIYRQQSGTGVSPTSVGGLVYPPCCQVLRSSARMTGENAV